MAVGQATGVSGGTVEPRSDVAPCLSSLANPGSLPALAQGLIKSQVAESMPKKNNLRLVIGQFY